MFIETRDETTGNAGSLYKRQNFNNIFSFSLSVPSFAHPHNPVVYRHPGASSFEATGERVLAAPGQLVCSFADIDRYFR